MKIGNKILELITVMRKIALNQWVNVVAKHCGLCAASDHFTDQCPQLQDVANLDAQLVAGIFQKQQGISSKATRDGSLTQTTLQQIHLYHTHSISRIP